ncbi:hypothetical protein HDV06_006689 [Boothiomyces sp. JEL0866]|nr:hypothetical protein HDV06_006689 [Boothiomyces sp. JEL0866]
MQVIQQDSSELPPVNLISINSTGATLCNTKIEHKDIEQPILTYSIYTAEKKLKGFAFSCSTEDAKLIITITTPNTATKIHGTEIELIITMPLKSVYNLEMKTDFGALVYVGDGTRQSEFKINSNSGNVNITNLYCDTLQVKLDLGAVKLVDYLASSSIDLRTNVGAIECYSKFDQSGIAKKVILVSDMGGIYGKVEGYKSANCTTSGLVDITLHPIEDSSTIIASHLGSVTANVVDFSGKFDVSIQFGLCNVTGKVEVEEKKGWMMGSSQKEPKLRLAPEELPSKIREIINTVYAENACEVPGAIFTVVHNGNPILQHCYGYTNFEKKIPVHAEKSLFRIASVTKSLTAAAVLTVWENRGFDLDSIKTKDINEILRDLEDECPEYSFNFRIPDNGFTEPLTLWNLLTHTGGLENATLGMDTHPFDDLSVWNLDPRLYNRTHLLDDNFPKRVYPPNTIHSYSNGGYVILGYILELLCRMPYPNALKSVILDPLEMNSSSAAINYEKDPVAARSQLPLDHPNHLDLTEPHLTEEVDGKSVIKVMPLAMQMRCLSMSDGSLAVTGADINNWMICLLNNGDFQGKRVISPNAIKLMTERQFVPHKGAINSANTGLFKMVIPESKGLVTLQHSGYITGHESQLVLFPQFNLGFFFSINHNGFAVSNQLFEELRLSLFESYSKEELVELGPIDCDSNPPVSKPLVLADTSEIDLKKYAGWYTRTGGDNTSFLSLFDKLQSFEVKLCLSQKSLVVQQKGNPELLPLEIDQVNNNLVCWRKADSEKRVFFTYYTTVGFVERNLPNNSKQIFLDARGSSFIKLQWYNTVNFHKSVIGFALGSSVVQLAYSAASKLFSFKISGAATALALSILSFPATVFAYNKSLKHKVDWANKRPPFEFKVLAGVSQFGIAVGTCSVLYKIISGKSITVGQDSLAILAGASTLAIFRRWNLEFYKL